MRVVDEVAAELSLPLPATEADIAAYCVRKIDSLLDAQRPVRNMAQLEKSVCRSLSLVIEAVQSDADLKRVERRYARAGEIVFAHLSADLDDGKYAAIYAIRQPHNLARFGHWVAVIDCRIPEKAARRYFSKWHEIAHLLTMSEQRERPYQPEGPALNDLERLMDAVAARIGFYPPLFNPPLGNRLVMDRGLTLAGIDRLREDFCQDASFQATARAAVERAPFPCVYLEAEPGLVSGTLRVSTVKANPSALANGIRISQGTMVPSSSIVSGVWTTTTEPHARVRDLRTERLSGWRRTGGNALPQVEAQVEACCVCSSSYGCVRALITPTELRDRWLASLPTGTAENSGSWAGLGPDPWL